MIKKFLFIHPKDINLTDFIHLDNFYYKYWPASYWEPEDEELDYDIRVDDEFYKNILIIPVELYEDDIKYFEHDGIRYHNMQEDGYIKFFDDNGYDLFWDGVLEDLADSEDQAKNRIESYIDELVETIVDNRISGT